MTRYANAANGAAGAYVAAVQALKAAGPIILLEPTNFENLLAQLENPLVVYAQARFLQPHRYLTNYRGLFFTAKSRKPLALPADTELVTAKTIWLPSF